MAVLINGTNGLIQAYDYQTPSTGFSYTFAAGTQTLVMNPAGTLATGTITMPPNPSDGMTITFSSTQQITALTLNGNTGQTIVGGVTSLGANQAMAYVYRSSNTSWFPLQSVVSQPIGVGQSYTDVTASRALDTTYTNSTGRPIFIVVTPNGFNGGSRSYVYLTVNGTNYGEVYTNEYYSATNLTPGVVMVTGIIPAGATYKITSGGAASTLLFWSELR